MRARSIFIGLGLAIMAMGNASPPLRAQTPPAPGAATAAGGAAGGAAPAPAPGDLKKRLGEIRDEPGETVRTPTLDDPRTRVAPPENMSARERRLPAPEPREDRPSTLPELSGAQKRALFATPGYQARFDELIRCREEVALARKAKPADVAARGVELRWMVGADGDVQGVQVVAAGPVDPDVLGCVHRKVSSWRISPPPNMPYRATHRLRFTRW